MNDCIGEQFELPARDDFIGKNFIYNDLNIKYVSYKINLCPSQYTSYTMTCFWEGDLEITLNVNGKEITINDHDQQKSKTSMIATQNTIYQFQGLTSIIINKDKNQIYLVFKITKCPN